MPKQIRKLSKSLPIWLPFLVILGLGLVVAVLLRGHNNAELSPKGLIATQQRQLMVRAVLLLLEIAIPTLSLFYFTAWKYRESNEKAVHDTQAARGTSVVFSIWAFPTTTMLLLAALMWPAAHQLAPQKAIEGTGRPPMTIEVVAMRWKWLFIYPEQNIASVNFVQVPVGTPVQFKLSADETPMSSFWIPQLGGQLYSMTGHSNLLNLLADKPGDFTGSSAELNGDGFADMKFTARASSTADFDAWVQSVKQYPRVLDSAEYKKLLTPSQDNPATIYSQAGPEIYDNVLTKYADTHGGHHTEHQL